MYRSSGYPEQSQVGHIDYRSTSSDTRLSPNEKKGKQADNSAVAAKGNVSYSPQDARSGLTKKPAMESESIELPQTAKLGLDKNKRQQKSPSKISKVKSKRESPVKEAVPRKEVKKICGNSNTRGIPSVPASGADATKNGQVNKVSIPVETEPISSVISPAFSPSKERAVPMTSIASDADVNQGRVPVRDVPSQPLQHQESPAIIHAEGSEFSTVDTKIAIVTPPPQTADAIAALSTDLVVNSKEQAKDVNNGVSHTVARGPSPQLIDESNSDDEAKNDVSFHSAPEVQSDSPQIGPPSDPQSEVRNEPLVADQGTRTLRSIYKP